MLFNGLSGAESAVAEVWCIGHDAGGFMDDEEATGGCPTGRTGAAGGGGRLCV